MWHGRLAMSIPLDLDWIHRIQFECVWRVLCDDWWIHDEQNLNRIRNSGRASSCLGDARCSIVDSRISVTPAVMSHESSLMSHHSSADGRWTMNDEWWWTTDHRPHRPQSTDTHESWIMMLVTRNSSLEPRCSKFDQNFARFWFLVKLLHFVHTYQHNMYEFLSRISNMVQFGVFVVLRRKRPGPWNNFNFNSRSTSRVKFRLSNFEARGPRLRESTIELFEPITRIGLFGYKYIIDSSLFGAQTLESWEVIREDCRAWPMWQCQMTQMFAMSVYVRVARWMFYCSNYFETETSCSRRLSDEPRISIRWPFDGYDVKAAPQPLFIFHRKTPHRPRPTSFHIKGERPTSNDMNQISKWIFAFRMSFRVSGCANPIDC